MKDKSSRHRPKLKAPAKNCSKKMTNLLYRICFVVLVWSDHIPGYDAEPIVDGQYDRDNEAIWQVSFQRPRGDGTWQHYCGGSIISKKHVITAAHCFVFPRVDETEVWDRRQKRKIVIGTNDLNSAANPGLELKISKVVLPKNYRNFGGRLLINDLAVVKLKHSLDLSINGDKYGPIHLFEELRISMSQELFVAGFGAVKAINGSDREEHYEFDGLRKILPVYLTLDECPKMNGLVCVQYMDISEEPKGIGCGDSGGPLYYRSDDKFELVGVISSSSRNFDIRKSCGKVAVVMIIPSYKNFLDIATNLKFNRPFPETSVEDFEKSGVDYVVLPDQAELAREYYSLPAGAVGKEAKKPCPPKDT